MFMSLFTKFNREWLAEIDNEKAYCHRRKHPVPRESSHWFARLALLNDLINVGVTRS
jgi:hypothetical protein